MIICLQKYGIIYNICVLLLQACVVCVLLSSYTHSKRVYVVVYIAVIKCPHSVCCLACVLSYFVWAVNYHYGILSQSVQNLLFLRRLTNFFSLSVQYVSSLSSRYVIATIPTKNVAEIMMALIYLLSFTMQTSNDDASKANSI